MSFRPTALLLSVAHATARNWHWHLTADTWNVVDMQQPFICNGVDNVVVEFIVIGSSGVSGQMRRDSSRQRVYLTGYSNQTDGVEGGLTAFKMRLIVGDANVATYGLGCPGSNSLSPALEFTGTGQLGTALDIKLSDALASTPVVMHIGLSSAAPIFPLDLGPLGAPGCGPSNCALEYNAAPVLCSCARTET